MDSKTTIAIMVESMWNSVDGVTQNLTDEQLNWAPPGKLNSISATFIHLLAAEDLFVQRILQGAPRFFDAQGWAAKIGIVETPSPNRGWEELKTTHVSLEPIFAYRDALRLATRAYLDGLSADELDRTVDFFGNQFPVATVLAIMITHAAGHAGELAVIKDLHAAGR